MLYNGVLIETYGSVINRKEDRRWKSEDVWVWKNLPESADLEELRERQDRPLALKFQRIKRPKTEVVWAGGLDNLAESGGLVGNILRIKCKMDNV